MNSQPNTNFSKFSLKFSPSTSLWKLGGGRTGYAASAAFFFRVALFVGGFIGVSVGICAGVVALLTQAEIIIFNAGGGGG